jgi:uncharacterized membrane protein YfcA
MAEYAIICLAAFAAGVLNAMAGGGTLLTYPALVLALPGGTYADASKVLANTTSTIALFPGSFAAAWGYRRELSAVWHWIGLLFWPTAVGGLIGSLLVTRLPESLFAALVPWLILTATLLFMLQPTIARLTGIGRGHGEPRASTKVGVVVFQFFVAVYGGYFGGGIGILMLSALALMGLSDIHQMNAAKTILAGMMNGISAAVFIAEGKVVWPYAGAMAVSSILGGYLGARVSRRVPRGLVRWIVIAIGLTLAAKFLYERWGARTEGVSPW